MSLYLGLTIGALFDKQIRNIGESSQFLLNILHSLREVDSIFEIPILGKQNKKEVIIDFSKDDDCLIQEIENAIIYFLKGDIKKYNSEPNPTKNFSRDEGFGFVITYKSENEKYSFRCGLGGDVFTSINTLICKPFNREFNFWFSVVASLAKFSKHLVRIGYHNAFYNDIAVNYKVSVGWITFISNDMNTKYLNQNNFVENEYTDYGNILITTKENI